MIPSKSELSYTISALLASPHQRLDGRKLTDFRPLRLSSGVYPQASGSARVESGGNEVVVGVTCVVENVDLDDADAGQKGSFKCNVICTHSAYPSLSPSSLDDISEDLTALLSDVYSQPSMLPANLVIIPGKKIWILNIDAMVLSDGGNILDILFIAVRAALHDCRVPATRSVQYKAQASIGTQSGLDTRTDKREAADFDLKDHWDDGDPLPNRDLFPVAVTLNLLRPVHFLDSTPLEAAATPVKVLLVFSFHLDASPQDSSVKIVLSRTWGGTTTVLQDWKELISCGQTYAHQLRDALDVQLSKAKSS